MHIKPRNVPVTIIGGASNTLIRDHGIPGVVIVLDKVPIISSRLVDSIECGAEYLVKKFQILR